MSHHHSREEIAKIEIGHTEFSPGVAWFLTLTFLAIILAVPLVQTTEDLLAIHSGRAEGTRHWPQCFDVVGLAPRRVEWSELAGARGVAEAFAILKKTNARISRDINSYEDELKNQSWLTRATVPWVQAVLTGVLKSGNEDAYCGRDGWLFYRADLDYLTGGGFLEPAVIASRAATGNEWKTPPQPDPVRAIVEFRNQLRARDIDLVLVPAPVKPMIYPERFTLRYQPDAAPLQNPSYSAFIARMEKEGVKIFDPAPLLARAARTSPFPLYLETDTHWTPHGMRLVATGLSEFIRERCRLPDREPVVYTTRPLYVTNLGDIAGMLKLPAAARAYNAETVEVLQVISPDGRPWTASENADVLLLGDSFANIFSFAVMKWGSSAGLAEHVSASLGRPLDAITRNAGGSYASREMLVEMIHVGRDRLAGKRLVIWEFAARDLASGNWKLIALPAPMVATSKSSSPEPAEAPIRVRARVEEVSRQPDTNAPYTDAVGYTGFRLIRAEAGVPPSMVFRVAAMSMRGRRMLPPAKWRPGEEVTLVLIPYAAYAQKHPEANRLQSLNDLDDMESDLYWLAEP